MTASEKQKMDIVLHLFIEMDRLKEEMHALHEQMIAVMYDLTIGQRIQNNPHPRKTAHLTRVK